MLRKGQLTNVHAQKRMCLGHRAVKRAAREDERGKGDNSQAGKDGRDEASLSADSAPSGNETSGYE